MKTDPINDDDNHQQSNGTNVDHEIKANGYGIHKIKFKYRESLFTQIVENDTSFRKLHNYIWMFVILYMISLIGDFIIVQPNNKYQNEIEIFLWNIKDFNRFFMIWSIMNLVILILHFTLVLFNNFVQFRQLLLKLSYNNAKDNVNDDHNEDKHLIDHQQGRIWNLFVYLAYFLISFFGIFVFAIYGVLSYDLKIALSFATLMEMSRLLMKSHSFFMEKKDLRIEKEELIKCLKNYRNKQNIFQSFWSLKSRAKFTKLLYYLFAPTLIYSDEYPRTKRPINWLRALNFFMQFSIVSLLAFHLICRIFVANLSRTGLDPFPLTFDFVFKVFLSSAVMYFLCFYTFLHTWHNFTAELLCFGDRCYYEDFWNVVTLKDYYRKWNHIVQKWIYVYIFLPIDNRFRNRNLTNFITVSISALMHELIIGLSLRFLFPINFLMFAIIGQMINFIEKIFDKNKHHNLKNLLFMISVFIGWSVQILFYCLEYYSRINCPLSEQSTFIERIKPRFIQCVYI